MNLIKLVLHPWKCMEDRLVRGLWVIEHLIANVCLAIIDLKFRKSQDIALNFFAKVRFLWINPLTFIKNFRFLGALCIHLLLLTFESNYWGISSWQFKVFAFFDTFLLSFSTDAFLKRYPTSLLIEWSFLFTLAILPSLLRLLCFFITTDGDCTWTDLHIHMQKAIPWLSPSFNSKHFFWVIFQVHHLNR